ncbi:zinc transport system substrate-binding protein [Halolactibacillus halophilus]|uniref:Zinc transport system substrate-binding protein n=1 Tax=Halolactibacillus halophilus TaxID=306540 RepID=A0A1I5S2I0_9BACI|nr:zinc ABC transporter substrate-binding protein [Halolactibacillus halophilus]GEM02442.1 hypothetical protein HHA03_19740 [Halolactibacillus halophilus]SFP64466.1 zinc transport system substrate-binding protein [Halolactibacillus halophilus]
MKHIQYMIIVMSFIGLLLVGCDASDNTNDKKAHLNVVTSFYPMYDFSKQVAGDRADVTMLLSTNQDAHVYEPSAKDVATVSEADIFVYSSDEMEFWAQRLLDAVNSDQLIATKTYTFDSITDHEDDGDFEEDNQTYSESSPITISGLQGHYHTGDVITLKADIAQEPSNTTWLWYKKTAAADDWTIIDQANSNVLEYQTDGENLKIKAVLEDEAMNIVAESNAVAVLIDDHEGIDPHVWLDPVKAQDQVNVIRDAFISADPEGESIYTENARLYNAQLQQLHESYEAAFREAENRLFVVQHQAFGHLAERYQLKQLSIGGLSTEVEPSPSRIAEINTLVEAFDIPVIYYQNGANSAIAQTVATETDTNVVVLYDFETLPESVDEDISYYQLMLENLEALKQSIH